MSNKNGDSKGFKMKIIPLIVAGMKNEDIVKKIGCSKAYPSEVRGMLKRMTEEERQQIIEKAMKQAKTENVVPRDRTVEEDKRLRELSGFRTPYTAQKNSKRIAISRY